jgi:hypothetical protein
VRSRAAGGWRREVQYHQRYPGANPGATSLCHPAVPGVHLMHLTMSTHLMSYCSSPRLGFDLTSVSWSVGPVILV